MKRAVNFDCKERWTKLPYYKGLPIPFTTLIDENGVPNFQAIDSAKVLRCILERRCGVCGEEIEDGWVAFIGGELCSENLVFIDPGMHPECAYYAAETCPYLKNADGAYSKTPNLKAPSNVSLALLQSEDKGRPKRMMIYFCRSYTAVAQGRFLMVQASRRPSVIDWNAMPESV